MESTSSENSFSSFIKGCRKGLLLSTDHLKIATVLIYIVLLLHIIGFSLPNWYEIVLHQTYVGSTSIDTQKYRVGLWKDCYCNEATDASGCKCVSKSGYTGLLKRIQILETVGLVGFIISGFVCALLICVRRQDRLLKSLNLILVTCSGACAISGVILFERETVGLENRDSFNYIVPISTDEDDKIPEMRSKLSVSFLLCTTAAGLCLFCIPLLIIDFCYKGRPSREEMRLIHVEHLAEGPYIVRQVENQHSRTPVQEQNQPLSYGWHSEAAP